MKSDLLTQVTARWIGHGRPGEVCLDGQQLNAETLNDRGLRERLWAKVRGFTGLELISCHVAAGPGRDFVRRLADILGIRVFASSRAVGPAHLGGTYWLDFGYCPDSGCDLPGYEAAPVPGLNHLMPLISVPFENGIVGDQGTNPNKLLKLTNFSTLNIQISFFQQNSSTGQFVDGGTQGNDIPGYLKIVLDDGTASTISGAINWQDKTGNTTETFGFLPGVDTDIAVLDAAGNPVLISTYEVDGEGDTIYENWVIRGENHSGGRISNFGLERIGNSLTYVDGEDNSGSADPVDVDDLNAYLTETQDAAPTGSVTVDAQSTSDTTPVITGTFDIDRTNGETLSVIINGQYYAETDPELTLTFDSGTDGTGTWTLDLNDDPGTTEEVEGQTLTVDSVYDVEATITDGDGYTLRDSTVDEISVVGEASVTVNDISVNEGSPYAVFEVTSLADTLIELAMQPGTATAGSGNDYAHSGAAIQTSVDGGASWQDYSAAVTSPTNGVILVRTSINNDTTPDNGETFTLTATIQGTSTSNGGTATIYDDGTGTIFNSDGSEDLASTKDDDRPVTVNSITVNEGSPYAVFNVSGAANQLVELSLPAGGTATGGGTDYGGGLEYWNGSAWVSYTGGTEVALDGSGDLLVRTTITNDTVSDDGETFTLSASNNGGTAASGTATIKDDGTGTLYPDQDPVDSTTPAVDDTSEKDNDTPVITAPTINDITVNEGSDYAVFTVTGSENTQINDMVVSDGGDGDTNMTNGLADNPVECWNGSAWVTFSNTSPVTIDSTGTLLLRISIVDEQDSFADNGEQFRLTLTPDGGSDIVGTATIDDDGMGVKYPGTVTDTTPDTDATDLDDDSDVVSINDVIVNEASDYAVNIISGANNLVLSNLSVLSAGDTVIQNFDLKVYDDSTNQWTDFVADATQLNEVGELLVRTTIIEERDDERDNGEVFTLSVNPTGTVTIVDDGSGTIFTGAVDPETGEAETTTIGLDNDGYEIKALCGWETSTYWQGYTFVTQHYNTENGRTVMSWETDGYTSFEIF